MRPAVEQERSEMQPMITRVRKSVSPATHLRSELSPAHVLIVDGNTTSREDRLAELRASGLKVSSARTGFEGIVKADDDF